MVIFFKFLFFQCTKWWSMEICTVAICCIKFMSAVYPVNFSFSSSSVLLCFDGCWPFLLLYRYFCNHFFQGWLQNVHLLRGAFASKEQTLSMQLLRNFLWAVYEISFFTEKNLVFAFRKSISTDLGPEFNCPRYQTLNCKTYMK